MSNRLEMVVLALMDQQDDWRETIGRVCEDIPDKDGELTVARALDTLREKGWVLSMVGREGPASCRLTEAGRTAYRSHEDYDELLAALETGEAALQRFVTHTDQPVVEKLLEGLQLAPRYARMICITALVLSRADQLRVVRHILDSGSAEQLRAALDVWSPNTLAEPGTLRPPFPAPELHRLIALGFDADDPETRRNAAALVFGLGVGDRYAATLTRHLIHPDPGLRHACMLALGTATDEFSRRALEAAVSGSSREDAGVARKALKARQK